MSAGYCVGPAENSDWVAGGRASAIPLVCNEFWGLEVRKPHLATAATHCPTVKPDWTKALVQILQERECVVVQIQLRDVNPTIKQDARLIASTKDHLIAPNQRWKQASTINNAKSFTVRRFTQHENAAKHCQVTDPSVVIDEIYRWLGALRERDSLE